MSVSIFTWVEWKVSYHVVQSGQYTTTIKCADSQLMAYLCLEDVPQYVHDLGNSFWNIHRGLMYEILREIKHYEVYSAT